MTKPLIPVSVLKNLRCGQCGKFVTCGPVHVTPDSRILCGRCKRLAKDTYRNVAFEALATLYRYPCYYWNKHCNEKLLWNESLDHEINCLFQSGCNVFCSKPGTYFKAERKLPSNTEINPQHVTDDLLEHLKCVACESYLSNSPVYIFVDGKNICHRCTHSNGVPKGAIRNLAYEAIASSVIFPCIYRFRGCGIRLNFGREMWGHENECSYSQVQQQKMFKKTSRAGKDGKERGVIETHSGHIWGTITPHSALFAPPKTKNNDGKIVTQELEEVMKKKHHDEVKGFDAQSMDSVVSKASTFDSVGDNISRSTGDNISRDNISRSTVDNISRENVSRSSSRTHNHDDYLRHLDEVVDSYSNEQPRPPSYGMNRQPSYEMNRQPNYEMNRQPSYEMNRPPRRANGELPMNYPVYPQEVAPNPTPAGYNKISHNGYYPENVARFGRPLQFEQYSHLYHYPPVYYDNSYNLNYSSSFQNAPSLPSQIPPKRSESFRVGNKGIIDELKERQHRKQNVTNSTPNDNNPYDQCNNLQDLVQKHDEGFH